MTPTNDTDGPSDRPQYGLYATPEEQRASIKDPDKYFEEFQAAALGTHSSGQAEPAVDAAAPTSSTPAAPNRRTTTSSQVVPRQATHSKPADVSAARQEMADGHAARHPADRIVTFILLAIGLFFSVAIVPDMLHPAAGIEASYKQFGIGAYHATSLTQVVGIGVAFIYVVGWLFAAFASMSRLRTGRRAWWVPAVVGVAVWILTMIGFAALMLNDPSFMNYATSAK